MLFCKYEPVSRNNRLMGHDGMIPKHEIWVKIGGDRSGGRIFQNVLPDLPWPTSHLKTHASFLHSRLVTLPSTFTLPGIGTKIRWTTWMAQSGGIYVKGLINTIVIRTNTNVIQVCRRQSDNTCKDSPRDLTSMEFQEQVVCFVQLEKSGSGGL